MSSTAKRVTRGFGINRRDFMKTGGMAVAGGTALSFLAACGSAAPSSGSGSGKSGGTLTEGYIYDIDTMNPVMATQRTTNELIAWLMFDGLVNPTNSGTMQPAIAAALPKMSDGGKTYTFTLRQDVKFTDGKPVTADDVVFTYNLFYQPQFQTVPSGWRPTLETYIDNISAPNPHTVVFNLKQPYAPFLTNYCSGGIMPKHILGGMNAKQITNATFNSAPTVSQGMFKFKNWTPGQSVTLVQNPGYYRGKTKIDSYVFQYIPDQDTIATQLKSGGLDFATIPLNDVNSFKSNSAFNVKDYVMPEVLFLYMQLNPSKPGSKILGDLNVRKALMMGIDDKAMVKSVFFGYAKPVTSSVIPATSWAYNPNPTPTYKFDVDKANSMLDAAGWKMGSGGVRSKGGVSMDLSIQAFNTEPYQTIAQVVQGAWKKLGVNASVQVQETPILENVVDETRDFDVVVEEYTFGIDPDPTDSISSAAANVGGENASDFRNAKVDQLLMEATATTVRSVRKKAYFQIQDILLADLPTLPMVSQHSVYAIAKRVGNFGLGPYTRYQRPWMKDITVSS